MPARLRRTKARSVIELTMLVVADSTMSRPTTSAPAEPKAPVRASRCPELPVTRTRTSQRPTRTGEVGVTSPPVPPSPTSISYRVRGRHTSRKAAGCRQIAEARLSAPWRPSVALPCRPASWPCPSDRAEAQRGRLDRVLRGSGRVVGLRFRPATGRALLHRPRQRNHRHRHSGCRRRPRRCHPGGIGPRRGRRRPPWPGPWALSVGTSPAAYLAQSSGQSSSHPP